MGLGRRIADSRIWVRLVISILFVVIISGAGLIHYSVLEQKRIAVEQAKDFAESIHQMTFAGLTGMMITGTVPLREIFLDQIKESNHIESLKVFRSDAVVKQYGKGLVNELPTDDTERMVLATGVPFFDVIFGRGGGERLRAIIPARATENYLGKNCLNCHEVDSGTVMGAVSMEISLDRANESTYAFGRTAVTVAGVLCIPLGFFIWYFVSQLVTRPLESMTRGLVKISQENIDKEEMLPVRSNDELGQATAAFNSVMEKAYELIQAQRLSRIVFDSSLEGITVTDAQARIQMVNKAFTDTTGYLPEEVIGKTPAILRSGKQDSDFYKEFWIALQEKGEWRGEIWNKRKNGSIYAEWLNISAVRDREGRVEYYVGIFADITERKQREDQIAFQAFHDSLTGLPNRILFRDRLDQTLALAKRYKERVTGVMFLDLDRFKQINDTLGHDAGDLLLKEVANRLKSCVRASDTVARMGGDEFTILLPEVAEEADVRMVAEKILESMLKSVNLGRESRVITTSIGIALSPQDGRDAETLLKAADAAMYQVKGSGRAGMCFFSPDLLDKPSRGAEQEARLRGALENREFVLHYQPIINLDDGQVHGYEALLRWQTDEGELLLPEDFLGLAEETGVICKVGEWVLDTACMQARSWQQVSVEMTVAVNISASEFGRQDFPELISKVLKKSGLPPRLLEIEISETLAMQDVEGAARIIAMVRDIGVNVLLDDFGTGFINLNALRRLGISTVKIDRSILRDYVKNPENNVILLALLEIARLLDLRVVAEGIENPEEFSILRNLTFNCIQGNLFSLPIPAHRIDPQEKRNWLG